MPLIPGSSPKVIGQNISEFHTGPTYAHTAAKFGPERARKQAVAIALHTARKFAPGGSVEPDLSWAQGSSDPFEIAAQRIRNSVHRNGKKETFPIQKGGAFDQVANAMFGPEPEGVMQAQASDPRSAIGRLLAGLGRKEVRPTRGVDLPSLSSWPHLKGPLTWRGLNSLDS